VSSSAPSLRLELGHARLSATLIIGPDAPTSELSESLVVAFLEERGLAPDPDRLPRIRQLLAEQAAAPAAPHSCIVAEGFPPKDGVDGRFEFDPALSEHTPPPPSTDADAPAHTDHYASRIGMTVREGAVLGRVIPPVDGFDGFDVFGNCLAARPARPSPIKHDDTIELASDGRMLAKVGGIIATTPGTIRVNPTLEINGNVDFSTGSVDFPGDVLVQGSVRDCFTVKAGRDLTVNQLVDGATLAAARDCTLRHGMASKDRHTLNVGRNLVAKYLSGVECHVGGCATIESDVSHSILHIKGQLSSPTCSVVHGELNAGVGCDVAELGSTAGVETSVIVASEDRSAAYVERAEHLLHLVQTRLDRTNERLKDLRSVHGRMTSSQADALTELSFEAEHLETANSRLNQSVARLRNLRDGTLNIGVTVRTAVHPGTRISIACWKVTFREPVPGPVRLWLNPSGALEFTNPDTSQVLPTPTGAIVEKPQAALPPLQQAA
jgi:hypothetical protein